MPSLNTLADIFPVTRKISGPKRWRRALAAHPPGATPEQFPDALEALAAENTLPSYLPDLARLEWAYQQAAAASVPTLPQSGPGIVNPTLELVRCDWRNLPRLLTGTGK